MYILIAILLFSFLIFIHELGHFITAKLSGIRVNEFALFMGPAIFQKKIGETTYSLRCLPVGGYCAMEGEDDDSDDPHAFGNVAWWKRLIVLVAGAAMNFLAGLAMFALLYAPREQVVVPEITAIQPWSTVGGETGLQVGDRVLSVNGEKIYVATDLRLLVELDPRDSYDVAVLRNGEKVILAGQKLEMQTVTEEDGTVDRQFGIFFRTVPNTFLENLKYAWANTLNTVRMVRLSLQMLFTGRAGLKDMTGVVGIVKVVSDAGSASATVRAGLMNVLYFGAFLAVNLAVMNLLPIPALDGGRAVCLLLTTAVEAVTHRKIDPKYEGYLHSAGMIILLGLMAIVTFKDIFVIFRG
ncbi:MAG: M50 family metallopeptidase [Faecousia sp.]